MLVEQYFATLEKAISECPGVRSKVTVKDKRSEYIGYFRADLYFHDGSSLHVREFVMTRPGIDRYTYAYHYQTAAGQLVFRYDNTRHYPGLTGFPHHKHTATGVAPATERDLAAVLEEAMNLL